MFPRIPALMIIMKMFNLLISCELSFIGFIFIKNTRSGTLYLKNLPLDRMIIYLVLLTFSTTICWSLDHTAILFISPLMQCIKLFYSVARKETPFSWVLWQTPNKSSVLINTYAGVQSANLLRGLPEEHRGGPGHRGSEQEHKDCSVAGGNQSTDKLRAQTNISSKYRIVTDF